MCKDLPVQDQDRTETLQNSPESRVKTLIRLFRNSKGHCDLVTEVGQSVYNVFAA